MLGTCRDPEKNWERSKVKGLVANLFTVADVCNATALEVVAGGRLYNVVVDTEVSFKSTEVALCDLCSASLYLNLYIYLLMKGFSYRMLCFG